MNYRPRISGVSLIELMVSLVIGSLLIIGAVTVYMQSRNTYRTTEAASRLQETARYAMEVIEPDIRMAGYWGLTNLGDKITNVAAGIPTACGANWTTDTVRFLDGRDNGNYNLPCAATSLLAGTDVLIVRRASSEAVPLNNTHMQIQTNRSGGVIFKSSTLPSDYGTPPISTTHDMVANAYYISNPAAGQFDLRRKTLVPGPAIDDQVIINGVADLQLQFGIDVGGDGNADRYVNPDDAVLATARIVSARIWIMVVAPDVEVGFKDGTDYEYANVDRGTFTDSRRRLVVSKTIQIRNSTP